MLRKAGKSQPVTIFRSSKRIVHFYVMLQGEALRDEIPTAQMLNSLTVVSAVTPSPLCAMHTDVDNAHDAGPGIGG